MSIYPKEVVFLTGGSEGIGRAMALELFRHKYRIALVSRNLEKLQKVEQEAGGGSPDLILIPADMTDPAKVESAVQTVVHHWGRVDVLINNLGQGLRKNLIDTDNEEWDQILRLNLGSAFLVCRAVLPIMRKQRSGQVINIASRSGRRGEGDFAAYCAAKHGMIGLTRALADSEASFGIRVNAICPGPVATEKMVSRNPKGDFSTWCTPEGIAQTVVFLLSNDGIVMNGRTMDLF